MERPNSYNVIPELRRNPSSGSTTSSRFNFGDQRIRKTLSDTESNKKESLASKQRRRISKNARKLVNNFGFKLNRENSNMARSNQKSIHLTGELYKKRQGIVGLQAKVKARLTKEEMVKKVWPQRFVELRNGVLSYYKIKVIDGEKVVYNRARGTIDLKQKGICLKLSYPTSESDLLPSEFQFDIVYNNILKPTEWFTYTFCCVDSNQFFTWVMALSHEIFSRELIYPDALVGRNTKANSVTSETFSVLTEGSNGNYRGQKNIPVIDLNRLITGLEESQQGEGNLIPNLVSPRTEDDIESVMPTETERDSEDNISIASTMTGTPLNRVRKRRFPMLRKRRVDFNVNLRKLDVSDRFHNESSFKEHSPTDKQATTRHGKDLNLTVFREILIYVGILQMFTLFLFFRGITFDVALVSVLVFDIILIRSLYAIFNFEERLLDILKRIFKSFVDSGSDTEVLENTKQNHIHREISLGTNSIPLPETLPVQRLQIHEMIPLDLTAMQFTDDNMKFDPFSFDFRKGLSHLNIEESKGIHQTWQYAQHGLLKLRVGPNYKSNKKKEPTETSFYIPVGLQVYHSPNNKKIERIMEHYDFPFSIVNPACTGIPESKQGIVPDLLVVNYQIPSGSFFKTSTPRKGEGPQSFIQFFSPADFFLNSLHDESTQDASTKLFLRWLEYAEKDQNLKHKLKLLTYIRNLKESGLPGWISKLNGKPCMVTKSCKMFRGSAFDPKTGREMQYLELDIDIAGWGMMVRRGVKVIVPNILKNLHWSVTLTIQGETDDELPERAINAMEFYKSDPVNFPTWPFDV